MIQRAILDTGPLVAYVVKDEVHHEWSRQQFEGIRPPLITCEAVLSEVVFLLARQPRAIAQVKEYCTRGTIEIRFDISTNFARVFGLIKKYANIPMSLADACLVCMAEQNAGSPVLTLDNDFSIYRMPSRRTIPVILPE